MSTKLYNGIKFNSNKFSEVIKQLHSLKEEAVNNNIKNNATHRGKQRLMVVIHNKPNIIDRKQEKGHYNMIAAFLFLLVISLIIVSQ